MPSGSQWLTKNPASTSAAEPRPRKPQARASMAPLIDQPGAPLGRPVHQPRFGGFPAQRQRGQRVGAQVDGQGLHDRQWKRDGASGQGENQERRDLGYGMGEDIDDELTHVVVNAPAASTAMATVAKLSSVSTMSPASRATSVPERPIATPMSARRTPGRR